MDGAIIRAQVVPRPQIRNLYSVPLGNACKTFTTLHRVRCGLSCRRSLLLWGYRLGIRNGSQLLLLTLIHHRNAEHLTSAHVTAVAGNVVQGGQLRTAHAIATRNLGERFTAANGMLDPWHAFLLGEERILLLKIQPLAHRNLQHVLHIRRCAVPFQLGVEFLEGVDGYAGGLC